MVKTGLSIGMAIGLAACGANVMGTIGDGKDIYHGKATPGLMGGGGTITMANENGRVCNGTFHYLIPVAGVAALRCNDGDTANVRFKSITQFSGWGTGKTSKGSKVSFAYGMSDDEARMYLDLPEQNLDDPNSTGAGSKRTTGTEPSKKEIIETGMGTGFFINDQGHIVTNNHVVKNCEYMQLRLADGTQQKADVLYTDPINDLAVIKVDYKPSVIATFPLTPSYRAGEEVLAFGFGLGYDLSKSGILTTGSIIALAGMHDDSRFMQITAQIQHGNSGGPLSDRMGNVIGINTSGLDQVGYFKSKGVFPEAADFSVKELVIKTFLKAHSIPFTEVNKTQVQGNADIGEQMRRFSVRASCFGYPRQSS